MKYFSSIILLSLLLFSCNDILEDPDSVRTGIVIEEEVMVSRIWKVQYFNNEAQSGPTGFDGVFLEFNSDNTFDLINSSRQVFTGEWALSANKDLLVIRSDGKIPAPYNEIENEWIILRAESDHIRVQERDPEGMEEFDFSKASGREIPNACQDITNLIQGKKWHIQHLVLANNNVTSEYGNFEFIFDDGASAIAVTDTAEMEGSWNAGIRCNKFHLGFEPFEGLKEISGLWQLSYFTESTIKLVINREQLNWEMKLVSGPNPVDNFCQEAESTVKGGSWTVSKFVAGNDSYGDELSGYFFQFKDQGKLVVFNEDRELTGNWSLVNNCEKMPLTIEGDNLLAKINEDWHLVLVWDELIKLIAESENNKKEIQFIRDPVAYNQCDSLEVLFEKGIVWHVSLYQVNEENLSDRFQGVTIVFNRDNSLIISSGDTKTSGSWNLKNDCKKIEIKTDSNDNVSEIALEWYITKVTEGKITLVYESETERIELQLTS